MPVYEYACTKCQHHFDIRHGADEKPALSCPQCESDVKKVFHAAGIIFKGSGWYVTDSASKGNGNGNGGGNSSTTTPAAEVKTETKTETKTPVEAKAD